MGEFWHGQQVYLDHVLSLLRPGEQLPSFDADQVTPSDITAWSPAELGLMIEEGRRQSDRQQSDLNAIRTRAQWLFTVGVTALAALGAGLAGTGAGTVLGGVWLVGMLGLAYGVGGAAAILVARADFKTIHTPVLSGVDRPVDLALARSYSRMMAEGENTVATRLTVFRQAVVFCLCGGYLGLVAAVLAPSV